MKTLLLGALLLAQIIGGKATIGGNSTWGPAAGGGGGGGGTSTVVQSVANTTSCNFGSCTITMPSAVTAGNTVIVEFTQISSSSSVTVADNLSNSLTQMTCGTGSNPQTFTGSGMGIQITWLNYQAPSSGINSFTFTFTGSFMQVGAFEVATSHTGNAFQACTADAYSVGNNNPQPSATPTSGNVASIACFFASHSMTPGTGWTGQFTVNTAGVSNEFCETQTQAGTTTMTASVNGPSGSDYPDAFMVIF